jgi:D-beta-D-heptose 7-phosphate kinase/D-beta-D-heptose 1-phosphate adenosyltransferase
MQLNKKIISRQNACEIVRLWQRKGKRVVFTNGCFDILHRGHIELLSFAKRHGDLLVVGLNSDDSVRRLKGPRRPLNRQEDRAILLAALEMVDYVVLFEEDTPLELIKQLLPDVLVKGGDYRVEEIVGREIVEQNGGKVVVFPLLNGFSTTAFIEQIQRDYEKKV